MTIPEIADILGQKFVESGFVVHRYDSYSTNSVYLKLDWGVANSIRISDHRGKAYLHYRYNVRTDESKPRVDLAGRWPRYFYPPQMLNKLISDIIRIRQSELLKSESRYNARVRNYKAKSQQAPGFWRQAYVVRRKADESSRTTETDCK